MDFLELLILAVVVAVVAASTTPEVVETEVRA
jgi:hypothetical protein